MPNKNQKIADDFCQRLKVIKGAQSTTSFAKKCGILESTLRSYLSGKSLPSIEKAALMAKVAHADLTWLITGKNSPNASSPYEKDNIPYYHVEILSNGYNLKPLNEPMPLGITSQKLTELGMDGSEPALIKMRYCMPYTATSKDVLFLAAMGQKDIRDDNLYIFTLGSRIFVKRLKYHLRGFEIIADSPHEKADFLSFTELEKTPLTIIAHIKAIFYAFD